MSKIDRRRILTLLLISIFTFACPGVALLFPSVEALVNVLQSSGGLSQGEMLQNLALSGGAIGLALIAIAVTITFLLVWLFTRKSKDPYDQQEPTGVSKDEPLPPTS